MPNLEQYIMEIFEIDVYTFYGASRKTTSFQAGSALVSSVLL